MVSFPEAVAARERNAPVFLSIGPFIFLVQRIILHAGASTL
ncbi:hypothetical protein ACPOL_6515 [Acidisarcina polymorpha]|uniref:Uncharacterized protein n=1 Tax=Acidisarcina polymorpha TaxID=2211140 RepID=A0A2Z5GA58_9BACT|nr:hypothetical protein ACPOL_6515 [Acidisarcina polymorpha]